jgi:hypothetical protein
MTNSYKNLSNSIISEKTNIISSKQIKNNTSNKFSVSNSFCKKSSVNEKDEINNQITTKLIGSFVNNKLEGFIILEKSNGVKFQGELVSNIAEGFGIYTNEYKMCYVGDWSNDTQNGVGIEYWPDGSIYYGEFNSGLKDGIGKYVWKDGSIYYGEWFKNSMNGFGEYLTFDKKVYRGQFYESMMHGHGYLDINNGDKFYIGSFERNKKQGFGIFIWMNPIFKAFVGFWKNSKQDGVGKYISEKKDLFSDKKKKDKKFISKYGMWKNGERINYLKSLEEVAENLDGNMIQYYEKFRFDESELISLAESLTKK